jgi:hypothetical protein
MFALYEQGCTAPEIARRCAEGTASVAPFQIPRRTVQQIVTTIARERKAKPPEKIEEISGRQVFEHYPERVGRLLVRELDRLERKEHNGNPLSLDDIERMRQGAKVVAEVRRIAGSPLRTAPAQTGDNGKGASEFIKRLRRDAERERALSESRSDGG